MEIGFKLMITISTINEKCRCNNYNNILNIKIPQQHPTTD